MLPAEGQDRSGMCFVLAATLPLCLSHTQPQSLLQGNKFGTSL